MAIDRVSANRVALPKPQISDAPKKTQVEKQKQLSFVDKLDVSANVKTQLKAELAKGPIDPKRISSTLKLSKTQVNKLHNAVHAAEKTAQYKSDPNFRAQIDKLDNMAHVVQKHVSSQTDLKASLAVNNTGYYQPTEASSKYSVSSVGGKYSQEERAGFKSTLSPDNVARLANAMGEVGKSMEKMAAHMGVTCVREDVNGDGKTERVIKFENGDKVVDTNGNGTLESKDFNLGKALNDMITKGFDASKISDKAWNKINSMDNKGKINYDKNGINSGANLFMALKSQETEEEFKRLMNGGFMATFNEINKESQAEGRTSFPQDAINEVFKAAAGLADPMGGFKAA